MGTEGRRRQAGREVCGPVVQGVAVLREDHELAPAAIRVEHRRFLAHQVGKLRPLLVVAEFAELVSLEFQSPEGIDLQSQLLGRRRCTRKVDERVLQPFGLGRVCGSVPGMPSFDPLASDFSPLIVYVDYKSPYAFVSEKARRYRQQG